MTTNVVKLIVVVSLVCGIVILIVELSKSNKNTNPTTNPNKPVEPTNPNIKPTKPVQPTNPNIKPTKPVEPANPSDINSLVKYLEDNNINMLGSDGCSKTSIQRSIFEGKLTPNIYVNCDLGMCENFLNPGDYDLNFPVWVKNGSIVSEKVPLSIQQVKNILSRI